jgi:hypothetical protein
MAPDIAADAYDFQCPNPEFIISEKSSPQRGEKHKAAKSVVPTRKGHRIFKKLFHAEAQRRGGSLA